MMTVPTSIRARVLPLVLALAPCLSACGADESETRGPTSADVGSTEGPAVVGPATEEEAESGDPAEAEAPEETEEPAPPPEPEPVAVEAGTRLGPIRIGMSEAELRGLGLQEREGDPRSLRFGPYRVLLDEQGVRRVEAFMGDLERIRIGERVLEVGTHIHEIRDAIGDCQWTEGGGERYRCADGSLFVHTTHTMDPARYTVAVERP